MKWKAGTYGFEVVADVKPGVASDLNGCPLRLFNIVAE